MSDNPLDVFRQQMELAFVADDTCPVCLGELDTGWECNRCDYDAKPIADRMPKEKEDDEP